MERLTKYSKETSHENGVCCTHFGSPECCEVGGNCALNCKWEETAWERLARYEDAGLMPKEVAALMELFDYALKESKTLTEQLTLLKHIRELAEADKDGRVLILPCKVGTRVYRIWYKIADYPDEPEMEIVETKFGEGCREDFGKTVFLTREEAEKALQEMEGKKDG